MRYVKTYIEELLFFNKRFPCDTHTHTQMHTAHNSKEATRLRVSKPIMFPVYCCCCWFFSSFFFSYVIFNFFSGCRFIFLIQTTKRDNMYNTCIIRCALYFHTSIICRAITIDVRIYLLKNKMKKKKQLKWNKLGYRTLNAKTMYRLISHSVCNNENQPHNARTTDCSAGM